MSSTGTQQAKIRRYSRWILLLFVVSWINLIVQAPVHAAMKQEVALSSHAGMVNCHCDATLCDTVLALEDQSSDIVHFAVDEAPGFQVAFVMPVVNPILKTAVLQDIKHLCSIFKTSRPPPLDITRILLI